MQYENLISKLLDLGIEEDINTGDVTTESIIPESLNAVRQDDSVLLLLKFVYPIDKFGCSHLYPSI